MQNYVTYYEPLPVKDEAEALRQLTYHNTTWKITRQVGAIEPCSFHKLKC